LVGPRFPWSKVSLQHRLTVPLRWLKAALTAEMIALSLVASPAWAVAKKVDAADPATEICRKGDQLLAQGQNKSAEATYREAVKAYPQSLLALSGLAACLLSQNKAYAALDQVNRIFLLLGHDPAGGVEANATTAKMPLSGWVLCAKIFHRTNHLDKCLYCYDAYLKVAPKSDEREQYEALAGVIRSQVNQAKTKTNTSSSQNVVTVGGAGDYFKDAVAEGLFRWPVKRFPLKIFITTGEALQSYKPEYEEAVRQSIDDWDRATLGQVGLKIVDSAADADINVNFVDDLHAPALRAEAGKAQLKGNMKGVDKANVLLLTISPFADQLMTKDFMRMISVHEIGHALGLSGHSPYEEDVMFPALGNQRGITSRDVATLYRLYGIGGAACIDSQTSDLTDKGKIQLLFAEASNAKDENDSARALECFEQILKIDSNNKNGRSLMACELNNIGLGKGSEPEQALKYFRWASYFDGEQEIFEKNIASCLFNLHIDNSANGRLAQAQTRLAAKDYRGAVVEYRAALKLNKNSVTAAKVAEAEKLAATQGFNGF